VGGPIQAGAVDTTVIHFSERFPVETTPCGKLGPAAGLWRYVTCVGCLERAPDDPRIKARLAAVLAELEQRSAGGV
jgi:hypothetical protein